MKKLIMISAMLCAFGFTHAQSTDTSYHAISAAKIVPFNALYSDTMQVDHLGVRLVSDDFATSATVYWLLCDSLGNGHLGGNIVVNGSDYASYAATDNVRVWLFGYVAAQLNKAVYKIAFRP